jgi:hypothetical protein
MTHQKAFEPSVGRPEAVGRDCRKGVATRSSGGWKQARSTYGFTVVFALD